MHSLCFHSLSESENGIVNQVFYEVDILKLISTVLSLVCFECGTAVELLAFGARSQGLMTHQGYLRFAKTVMMRRGRNDASFTPTCVCVMRARKYFIIEIFSCVFGQFFLNFNHSLKLHILHICQNYSKIYSDVLKT